MNKIVPILIFLLSAGSVLYGQRLQKLENGISLDGVQYLESENEIEYMKFNINSMTIETAQVFGPESNSGDDFYCRAIVQTKSEQGIIDQLYFNDIEPVGSSFGICFIKNQISKKHVIGSKFGDYSGLLIIIDSSGKILKVPGGNYFTYSSRFIISDWYSDLSGISIYDLEMNKVVYSQELPVYISKWHEGNGKLYVAEWDGEREVNNIYSFDLKDFLFSKTDLNLTDLHLFPVVKEIGCEPN